MLQIDPGVPPWNQYSRDLTKIVEILMPYRDFLGPLTGAILEAMAVDPRPSYVAKAVGKDVIHVNQIQYYLESIAYRTLVGSLEMVDPATPPRLLLPGFLPQPPGPDYTRSRRQEYLRLLKRRKRKEMKDHAARTPE